MTFIELPLFTELITDLVDDTSYAEFQKELPGIQTMKRKDIEFDAEALVGSVEALAAHVRGERKLTLRTHAMTLPEPIEPLRPRDVAAIRRQLNVSQSVFAALLNVPKVTAISWEKGRRKPTGAALRLL
ncbi:MAG: helix-turn-helix domain-containing protein, partial [Chloroflexi bacterium]|nr:helix-turn-helix domain-containing protein [Chloroflexota bacterium]